LLARTDSYPEIMDTFNNFNVLLTGKPSWVFPFSIAYNIINLYRFSTSPIGLGLLINIYCLLLYVLQQYKTHPTSQQNELVTLDGWENIAVAETPVPSPSDSLNITSGSWAPRDFQCPKRGITMPYTFVLPRSSQNSPRITASLSIIRPKVNLVSLVLGSTWKFCKYCAYIHDL